jgi:hypothetical protein
MDPFLWIVFWITLCVATGIIASRRNRSDITWAVLVSNRLKWGAGRIRAEGAVLKAVLAALALFGLAACTARATVPASGAAAGEVMTVGSSKVRLASTSRRSLRHSRSRLQ